MTLAYSYTSLSIFQGSQGRQSEQEPKGRSRTRGRGEGCFLAALHGVHELAFMKLSDHPPRGNTAHNEWPPTSIINQENTLLVGQLTKSMKAISDLGFPLPNTF